MLSKHGNRLAPVFAYMHFLRKLFMVKLLLFEHIGKTCEHTGKTYEHTNLKNNNFSSQIINFSKAYWQQIDL